MTGKTVIDGVQGVPLQNSHSKISEYMPWTPTLHTHTHATQTPVTKI